MPKMTSPKAKKTGGVARPKLAPKKLAKLFADGSKLRQQVHEQYRAQRTVEESALRFVVR